MSESNEVVKKEVNIIWSWLLRAGEALGIFSPLLFKNFTQLPDDLTGAVAGFLTLREKNRLASTSTYYQAFFNMDHFIADDFIGFVAVEGEDNQNRAEIILKKHKNLVPRLLLNPRENMRDAAGRRFLTPISAYGYAYWAGDTHMRHMMEKYMDEDQAAKALNECKNIAEHGVEFMLKGKRITHAKHFDFQPLISAYDNFAHVASSVQDSVDRSACALARVDEAWLEIGLEQAKLPTHVAQAYCGDSTMKLYVADGGASLQAKINNPMKRSFQFYNCISENIDSWFLPDRPNPKLGELYTIYTGQMSSRHGMDCDDHNWSIMEAVMDLTFIKELSKVRMVDDLKKTRDCDLTPSALSARCS